MAIYPCSVKCYSRESSVGSHIWFIGVKMNEELLKGQLGMCSIQMSPQDSRLREISRSQKRQCVIPFVGSSSSIETGSKGLEQGTEEGDMGSCLTEECLSLGDKRLWL